MLSAAKHLAFSATYKDEILRLLPQDDIATQSLGGERKSVGVTQIAVSELLDH
jgi:hypothetical protein